MWRLSVRGENRSWSELGGFETIGAAALQVLKLDRNPSEPAGSLFFRVYVDPMMDNSDAEILSRLEYQGAKGFYLLTRQVQ